MKQRKYALLLTIKVSVSVPAIQQYKTLVLAV